MSLWFPDKCLRLLYRTTIENKSRKRIKKPALFILCPIPITIVLINLFFFSQKLLYPVLKNLYVSSLHTTAARKPLPPPNTDFLQCSLSPLLLVLSVPHTEHTSFSKAAISFYFMNSQLCSYLASRLNKIILPAFPVFSRFLVSIQSRSMCGALEQDKMLQLWLHQCQTQHKGCFWHFAWSDLVYAFLHHCDNPNWCSVIYLL